MALLDEDNRGALMTEGLTPKAVAGVQAEPLGVQGLGPKLQDCDRCQSRGLTGESRGRNPKGERIAQSRCLKPYPARETPQAGVRE